MSNKTLKDTLIDLYHSGDLAAVWDEDDTGRFVAELRIDRVTDSEWRVYDALSIWYLENDPDTISEALASPQGRSIAMRLKPDGGPRSERLFDIGRDVIYSVSRTAFNWAKSSDAWDEAKDHITELENSHD